MSLDPKQVNAVKSFIGILGYSVPDVQKFKSSIFLTTWLKLVQFTQVCTFK